MDPRTSEPMSDADLDREIARALDIEPSPAFVARVRQHVAAPARHQAMWWVPVAAAVAAGLTVALVIWKSGPDAGSAQRRDVIPSRPIAAMPGAMFARSALPGSILARRRSTDLDDEGAVPVSVHRALAGERVAPPANAEPEVLISAAEARAIRNLIAGLRNGGVDAASLTPDQPPASEITIPAIAIAPVTVSPLEGERQ